MVVYLPTNLECVPHRSFLFPKHPFCFHRRHHYYSAFKMAVTKKSSSRKPSSPKRAQSKLAVATILPAVPKQPPQQTLDLDVYEVGGLVWEMAAVGTPLVSFIGLVSDAKLRKQKDSQIPRLLNFLLSKPGVEEDDVGSEWTCARYLGAGSFGRVGLWVKKSKDGKVVDTVAIKEADRAWRPANTQDVNLPIEVAINRDLNIHDQTHINYLRGYRYGKATQRGRLYLRHYKYGDLDMLHKAYAIYGHWLPEWFCFELLRDFCKSLKALSQPPPQDTKVDLSGVDGKKRDRTDFETVHQDMKPENVFVDEILDRGDMFEGVLERPTPVLADFGEAAYTHEKDFENPRELELALGGTPGYKPAVSLRTPSPVWKPTSMQEELRTKRLLDREAAKKNASVDEEEEALPSILPGPNNIWGIGRILFELMTHVQGTDFGRVLKINQGDDDYDEDYEEYVATERFSDNLGMWKKMVELTIDAELAPSFPYSDDLRSLVADMMHPEPSERPTVEDVERRAEASLTAITSTTSDRPKASKKAGKAKPKPKPKPKLHKLYYTQEHWAKIPDGAVKWRETKHVSLEWLRTWARSLLASSDPEGPLIRKPDFMDRDEWTRVSSMARNLTITDMKDEGLIAVRDAKLILEEDAKKIAARDRKRKRDAAKAKAEAEAAAGRRREVSSTNRNPCLRVTMRS